MAGRGGEFRSARAVALCGILAALALVFLFGACVVPTGQLGLTAVAGLFPMAAVISVGVRAGFLCWAAAGLLGLLLVPDKGCAVLFLLFLGLYPVVKSLIERLRNLPAEWVLKLLFFNAMLAVSVLTVGGFLFSSLPSVFRNLFFLWPAANAVFVVYDIGLSKLAQFYSVRVDRHMKRRA